MAITTSITVLHVQGHTPEDVERALEAIFAREERSRTLRIEGTFSAVLARALDSDLDASYRYLLCRPHPDSAWTPLLELGNRTEGLDVELSRALDGCAVFTTFVYGDVLAGYRLARGGAEIDRYASDPTYYDETGAESADEQTDPREYVGHPDRFADLLPAGTSPEDFVRVVLRPGYWEEQSVAGQSAASEAPSVSSVSAAPTDVDDDEEELVDETDRMRCIALALELWGPTEYPFAQDPEEIPNNVAGPAIALAFA